EDHELQARKSDRFVVEIELRTGTIDKLTTEDLQPIWWDPRTDTVEFRKAEPSAAGDGPSHAVYFRKNGMTWERLTDHDRISEGSPLDIRSEEDLNVPSKIVAIDRKTGQKGTILDLNPQLASLALGKVENVRWSDASGQLVQGGLYFPPDYLPGSRYPLVIQT